MNRNTECSSRIPFNIFARANSPPSLMEKNEGVYLICMEGNPSLMKIKVGFYIFFFYNYHEATATRKKQKKSEK